MSALNEKIVEPVPTGLPGHLAVEEKGVHFARGDTRIPLGSRFAAAEKLGLKPGDVLSGWLQCYRGWTAQPAALVEQWLEQAEEEPAGKIAPGEIRAIFRVSDFERLDSIEAKSMTLFERKVFLDRHVKDRDELQKNPYLILDEGQVASLLASQPAASKWQVRMAGRHEKREEDETFDRRVVKAKDHTAPEKLPGEGLDLAVAGGWLDLADVEGRIRHLENQLQEKKQELRQVEGERDQLAQTRKAEERLRAAGRRYLDLLRSRGERCIRALAAGSDVDEGLQAFSSLFESPETDFEALEKRTEGLQRELEQIYPTEPVARSSSLDPPTRPVREGWGMYQVQGKR